MLNRFLDGKQPGDRRPVTAHKIERRQRSAGDWAFIGVTIESEATHTNQERSKDSEYRTGSL